MGYSPVFDFKVVILIFSIMKLFAIQFLGVAMLMLCAFAAPLAERGNVFKCDTEGEMSSGGHKMKCRRMDSEPNEMQRSWHPTGKVLGNVIGGVVGKLRGENLMQNGPGGGEEENLMQNGGKRGGDENLMQNGEKRGGDENLMQNG